MPLSDTVITVAHKLRNVPDLPFDDGFQLGYLLLRQTAQQRRRRADGRQGIAQFVREHGKELRLLPTGLFRSGVSSWAVSAASTSCSFASCSSACRRSSSASPSSWDVSRPKRERPSATSLAIRPPNL
jgi:hypothetical protein